MNRPKFTIHRGNPRTPPPAPVEPALPPPATPPRVSPPLGLPPVSSVCEDCGVYVIRPEVHENWHRETDRRWRRWRRFRDLVLDVFLARGYITTTEKATATRGDT